MIHDIVQSQMKSHALFKPGKESFSKYLSEMGIKCSNTFQPILTIYKSIIYIIKCVGFGVGTCWKWLEVGLCFQHLPTPSNMFLKVNKQYRRHLGPVGCVGTQKEGLIFF